MKTALRALSSKQKLKGVPVLVRVDWNVPEASVYSLEGSLKLERSVTCIKDLAKRGAIVILLTHFGRPKKKDRLHSTKFLTKIMRRYGLSIEFHPELVTKPEEYKRLAASLKQAESGSIHLLENVRFEKGEEDNLPSLAKAWGSLGDLFVNDAFASCHRSHASVVGLAKILPSYAGPSLVEEVEQLENLLGRPSSQFVAIIGGKKLTTKLPVLKELLKKCEHVLIGGAMATPFLSAKNIEVGKSYMEPGAVSQAKKIIKTKNILLPKDLMVTERLETELKQKRVSVEAIEKKQIIVDVGPQTLAEWSSIIGKAKTILWNGPIGWTESYKSGSGSRFVARIIATRSKGRALGIAGGGDTLPVIADVKASKWMDFVSTGGGAMLEFIATKGQLPGLKPLRRS